MKDYVIKATSQNDEVRAYVATTREMIEKARTNHNTTKVATAALGRTLTATSMMGLMMKNEKDELTVIIKGGGQIGTILATSDAKGKVRGYVQNPNVQVENYPNGKLNVAGAVGTDGYVKVIKDLGLKEPYIGSYPLVSGEIAEDFTHYFALSEQTPSVVSLGVLTRNIESTKQITKEDGSQEMISCKEFDVEQAGGFIVQLMPFASEETISTLEKNIKDIPSITTLLKSGKKPEDILEIILKGLNPKILDMCEVGFECNCSKERISQVLQSIGKKELQIIIDEDKKAEVTCHFCNNKYHFTEEELIEILNQIK